MQKRFLSVLAASLIAAVLFSSCSKNSNKQGLHIPAGAGVVIHFNGESLNSKLSWDEIKQTDMMKKVAADTTMPSFIKALLDNPENSGINIKSDLEFFMVKDSSGAYMSVEGAVKDEAKFKQLLANGPKDAKETSKDGKTYFTDERASIGYDKDMFIATVNLPQLAMIGNYQRMSTDTMFGGMDEIKYDRDMSKVTSSLFELKEDASLAKSDHFSELMNTKGDVHLWYSYQNFNMAGNMGALSAFADTKKLTDGAEFTGTLNFEDGKVVFDAKSYGSKEINEIYKKYSGDSFDKTMIKNIPSKNLAGMMIINFKPQGMLEILKLANLDGFANIGLAQLRLSMDDLIKADKGDIMIAAADIKPESDTAATEKVQVIFATSIGDRTAFNKIIDAGKKYTGMMGENPKLEASGYAMNDKYFAISNTKANADAWLAGSANNSFSFMDNISGGPFGGYVNFQYILGALRVDTNNDSLTLAQYDLSLKMFDDMKLSGGNFKDGGITQHWELNLVDKKTNSLKQFNSYASAMGMIEEQKRLKREEMWKTEDEKIPLPPPQPAH